MEAKRRELEEEEARLHNLLHCGAPGEEEVGERLYALRETESKRRQKREKLNEEEGVSFKPEQNMKSLEIMRKSESGFLERS